MTPDELIGRGHRAQQALEEFVQPAIDAARAEYLEALTRVAAIEPWNTAKIVNLAAAKNVVDKVEAHLRLMIAHGKDAAAKAQKTRQIEELPHVKKRWI